MANFIRLRDWVMGVRLMINVVLDASVKHFWMMLTFE